MPPARRVTGPGATIVMAPFTHTSPERPSRFSAGSYGLYYAAMRFETALREARPSVVFHLAAQSLVRRGYRAPTSFHDARLRQAPPGYIFDVITRGFGAMPDYAAQVPVADRWAIAAYMKALQLSQDATIEDVPADRRGELDTQ